MKKYTEGFILFVLALRGLRDLPNPSVLLWNSWFWRLNLAVLATVRHKTVTVTWNLRQYSSFALVKGYFLVFEEKKQSELSWSLQPDHQHKWQIHEKF